MLARPVVRIAMIAVLLIAALFACGLSAFLLLNKPVNPRLNAVESLILRVQLAQHNKDLQAAPGTDNHAVCFTVNQGDNASTIGANLAKQGFVKDGDLFRIYAHYYGIDAQLQAGTYSLKKTLTLPEIAQTLTNVGANTITFQVIEGKRIEEIMQAIDQAGLSFRGDDFYLIVGPGAASRSQDVKNFAARVAMPEGRSLEGFLFPDTYTLPACARADDLVTRLLQNFDNRITNVMQADVNSSSLTLYQVVTLASIVEREAVVPDERPVIASVYLNRLHKPMKLDADPTIQYALGNKRDPNTWWPNLTPDDYRPVVNPYNTYLNDGLQPGPLANLYLSSLPPVL